MRVIIVYKSRVYATENDYDYSIIGISLLPGSGVNNCYYFSCDPWGLNTNLPQRSTIVITVCRANHKNIILSTYI